MPLRDKRLVLSFMFSIISLIVGYVFLQLRPVTAVADDVLDETPVGSLSIASEETDRVKRSIPVGGMPAALALDAERDVLYVANFGSNTVSVIDAAAHNVIAEIDVGVSPSAIELHPNSPYLFVNNQGSDAVSVIDRDALAVAAHIPVGDYPWTITLDAERNRVYTINHAAASLSIIDAASLTPLATIPTGAAPMSLALDKDGIVYVANSEGDSVSIINPVTEAISTLQVKERPVSVRYNPVNEYVYVTYAAEDAVTLIDTAAGVIAGELSFGANQFALQHHSEKGQVYLVTHDHSLLVLDESNQLARHFETVPFTPDGMAFDEEKEQIYLSSWERDAVLIVDPRSGQAELVPVGDDPAAMVVDSERDQLFVVNTQYPADGIPRASTVSVLNASPLASTAIDPLEARLPDHYPPAIYGGGGSSWRQSCIDCPRTFKGIQERSIVIDDEGRIHVAYGQDKVYYGLYEGGQWRTEAATDSGVGGHISLALDSQNRPHISFWDDRLDALSYAHREGDNQWRTQIIDNEGRTGLYTSLALDSQDHPHITYYDFGLGRLQYAHYNGAEWIIERIDGDGGMGWNSSLVLDSEDKPHVSYYDNLSHVLKYAFRTSDGWRIELISDYTSYYSSLAIDAANNVYVSYLYHYNAAEIKLGRRTDSGWQVETVPTGPSTAGHVSLRIDGNGRPHVTYYDDRSDDGSPNSVRYAYKDAGIWRRQTVVDAYIWEFPALALDANGDPAVAFYDNDADALRVARRTGSGWTADTVDAERDSGVNPDLVIDSNDNPVVVYNGFYTSQTAVDASATTAPAAVAGGGGSPARDIIFSQRVGSGGQTGDEWTTHRVGVGTHPSVALDEQNHPHISYIHYRSEGRQLIYAHDNGDGWYTTTVASSVWNTIIALDSAGQPHIAYTVNKSPGYAIKTGGIWVTDTLPVEGDIQSFAVDANDRPHFVYEYYNGQGHVAEYAYWTGTHWAHDPIGYTQYGKASMDLDDDNTPHFSYCTSSGPVYAWRTASDWNTQFINSIPCIETAIVLDAGGAPHIAYVEADTRELKYARWTDAAWQIEAVNPGIVVSGDLSMHLDATGNPSIGYHDQTNIDLRLAQRGTPPTEDNQIYLPTILGGLSNNVGELRDQISVTSINLPVKLEGTSGNWCTWGGCSLGPRLYHEPLAGGDTLLGWTDEQGDGHISLASGGEAQHWDFPGTAVRGLVAHDDGAFAVLLWNEEAEVIRLSKRGPNNTTLWTTELNSDIAVPDFWLGDGRLEYGDGRYAAYFTVRGVSGGFTGHYGDQLTYVDDNGVIQSGGWDWGCSHSMSQLVTYHPDLNEFAAVCSSDCFPDKSIHWVNASQQIYQADGNCGGNVSAQLGQMALAEQSWKLVFNAMERPCCEGKGIGLATLDANQETNYVWLTDSNGEYERDPVITRLGTSATADRYLVGWMTTNDQGYWLAVIDDAGVFVVAPENVSSASVSWGYRNESFRTDAAGNVSWVQADPGGESIRLFHFDGSPFLP